MLKVCLEITQREVQQSDLYNINTPNAKQLHQENTTFALCAAIDELHSTAGNDQMENQQREKHKQTAQALTAAFVRKMVEIQKESESRRKDVTSAMRRERNNR